MKNKIFLWVIVTILLSIAVNAGGLIHTFENFETTPSNWSKGGNTILSHANGAYNGTKGILFQSAGDTAFYPDFNASNNSMTIVFHAKSPASSEFKVCEFTDDCIGFGSDGKFQFLANGVSVDNSVAYTGGTNYCFKMVVHTKDATVDHFVYSAGNCNVSGSLLDSSKDATAGLDANVTSVTKVGAGGDAGLDSFHHTAWEPAGAGAPDPQNFLNFSVNSSSVTSPVVETLQSTNNHTITVHVNKTRVHHNVTAVLSWNGTNYTATRTSNQTIFGDTMEYNFSARPIPTLIAVNGTSITGRWHLNFTFISGGNKSVLDSDTTAQTWVWGYHLTSVPLSYSINESRNITLSVPYSSSGNATLNIKMWNGSTSLVASSNSTDFFTSIYMPLIRNAFNYNSTILSSLNVGFNPNVTRSNESALLYPMSINFSVYKVVDPAGDVTNFTLTAESITYNETHTFNTTKGHVNLSLFGGVWNFSITSPSVADLVDAQILINATTPHSEYQYRAKTIHSINFTIRDEQNRSILRCVTGNTSCTTIELIAGNQSYNYTAVNGSLYVDLLVPESYTIRYSKPNYGRIRQHLFELNNGSTNTLDLYLLRDDVSSDLTITVFDEQELNTIGGVVVYLERYRVDTNEYFLVNQYLTGPDGLAFMDVEQKNEQYRFKVDKPWKTLRRTYIPQYIESTTLNLYMSLRQSIGESYFKGVNMTALISFDRTTNTFSTTWNDPSKRFNEFCFRITKLQQYGRTVVNESCSSSSSASINLVLNTENTTYSATLLGDGEVIATSSKTLKGVELNSQEFGILLSAGVFVTFTFLTSVNPMIGVMGSLGLLFARLLQFINIDITVLVILLLTSWAFGMVMNKRR